MLHFALLELNSKRGYSYETVDDGVGCYRNGTVGVE